ELNGEGLTIAAVEDAARANVPVELTPHVRQRMQAARAVVDRVAGEDTPVYGVTTGVGSQKDFRVSQEEMAAFNRKLLRAHATVLPGPDMQPEVLRAALVILVNGYANGKAGI